MWSFKASQMWKLNLKQSNWDLKVVYANWCSSPLRSGWPVKPTTTKKSFMSHKVHEYFMSRIIFSSIVSFSVASFLHLLPLFLKACNVSTSWPPSHFRVKQFSWFSLNVLCSALHNRDVFNQKRCCIKLDLNLSNLNFSFPLVTDSFRLFLTSNCKYIHWKFLPFLKKGNFSVKEHKFNFDMTKRKQYKFGKQTTLGNWHPKLQKKRETKKIPTLPLFHPKP